MKNIVDTIFFTPDVFAAGRLQTSCDPIGENADMKGVPFMLRIFSSGAALESGMFGESKDNNIHFSGNNINNEKRNVNTKTEVLLNYPSCRP